MRVPAVRVIGRARRGSARRHRGREGEGDHAASAGLCMDSRRKRCQRNRRRELRRSARRDAGGAPPRPCRAGVDRRDRRQHAIRRWPQQIHAGDRRPAAASGRPRSALRVRRHVARHNRQRRSLRFERDAAGWPADGGIPAAAGSGTAARAAARDDRHTRGLDHEGRPQRGHFGTDVRPAAGRTTEERRPIGPRDQRRHWRGANRSGSNGCRTSSPCSRTL